MYSELDPLTEAYLLTSGTVRLFVGEGVSAKTTLLLGAPALFGDRDILAACAVSQESARSVSKANLLCYDRAEVLDAFESASDVRAVWVQDLLARYARSIRHIGYLAQPIEKRVLWLLYEEQRAGRTELPNYESLALMADSAVKSIGRAVRALVDGASLVLDEQRGFRLSEDAVEELEASELVGLVHRMVEQK